MNTRKLFLGGPKTGGAGGRSPSQNFSTQSKNRGYPRAARRAPAIQVETPRITPRPSRSIVVSYYDITIICERGLRPSAGAGCSRAAAAPARSPALPSFPEVNNCPLEQT